MIAKLAKLALKSVVGNAAQEMGTAIGKRLGSYIWQEPVEIEEPVDETEDDSEA